VIQRAKNAPEESAYVRALQRDARLRGRILKLGSAPGEPTRASAADLGSAPLA
jgi:hypothetical protein